MARFLDYVREVQNSYKVQQVQDWYTMATGDEEVSQPEMTELGSIANAAIARIQNKGKLNEETSSGSTTARPMTPADAYPIDAEAVIEDKKGVPRVESDLFKQYRQWVGEAKTLEDLNELISEAFGHDTEELNEIDRMWLRKDKQQAINRIEGKITPYHPFVRAGLDAMAISERPELIEFTELVVKKNSRDLNSSQRQVINSVLNEVKVIEGWD